MRFLLLEIATVLWFRSWFHFRFSFFFSSQKHLLSFFNENIHLKGRSPENIAHDSKNKNPLQTTHKFYLEIVYLYIFFVLLLFALNNEWNSCFWNLISELSCIIYNICITHHQCIIQYMYTNEQTIECQSIPTQLYRHHWQLRVLERDN